MLYPNLPGGAQGLVHIIPPFWGLYPVPHTHKTLKNEAESRLVGAVQAFSKLWWEGRRGLSGSSISRSCAKFAKLACGLKWMHLQWWRCGIDMHTYTNNPKLLSASARSQCTSQLLSRQESKIRNWSEVKWSTRIWRSWNFNCVGERQKKKDYWVCGGQ